MVRDGKFDDQFVVDMVQGGAGTSTNMNANEVIANIALELMGHKKGEYKYCHPDNDVNLSQSTNGCEGPHGHEDSPHPQHRQAGGLPRNSSWRLSVPRASSPTSSRWDARSCRTPYR